jgi:hypothetical protein
MDSGVDTGAWVAGALVGAGAAVGPQAARTMAASAIKIKLGRRAKLDIFPSYWQVTGVGV